MLALFGSCNASERPGDTTHSSIRPASLETAGACAAVPLNRALADLVNSILSTMRSQGGARSEALVVPSTVERDAFGAAVVSALLGESSPCGLPASYRLFQLADPGAGQVLVVAEADDTGRPSPALFWGTYALLAAPDRALAVEAPHSLFDTGTAQEAVDLTVQSRAQWLLLNGAHRCANDRESGCSGTTTACGGRLPFKIADAAHSIAAPFFAVHAELSNRFSSLAFLQLHGNSQSACPDALVSDGSISWSDAGYAGQLAAQLDGGGGLTVGRCGGDFPVTGCDLCGTTNVQARFTAGSADSCTVSGSSYGRVVHLEQSRALRNNPQALIDAAIAVFP